ncbi:MAG: RNA polymerase subunit sigma, partial [Planctomycetaceae bacterium]|nr:RNA polymerase subunit sigma [Planctomycetaceae bacterium]
MDGQSITEVLREIEAGDPAASEKLLPLVYEDLRRFAERRLAMEPPGQTLQATALVHEAYLTLAGSGQEWNHRGHFFMAAAEAIRRILIRRAEEKRALKR